MVHHHQSPTARGSVGVFFWGYISVVQYLGISLLFFSNVFFFPSGGLHVQPLSSKYFFSKRKIVWFVFYLYKEERDL
jgi:hypothetical protein